MSSGKITVIKILKSALTHFFKYEMSSGKFASVDFEVFGEVQGNWLGVTAYENHCPHTHTHTKKKLNFLADDFTKSNMALERSK